MINQQAKQNLSDVEQRKSIENAMPSANINQSINPNINPYTNGTGSARPVFNQFSQDAINSVNQGQKMGDVMFNNTQQVT